MSNAFSAVLDDLIRFPGLGLKVTVSTSSSAATATSVSPVLARYANETTFFHQHYLYIPSAAATDDQVRTVVSHAISGTTTTFTFQDASNYAETLSGVTGYILPLHPDTFMDTCNQALERMKVRVEVPLMHGPASGDMQGGSVDADWTETNATDTVQTTAAEVNRGAQSTVVTDSGSGGGYTASAAQRVGQGQSITVFGEAKADTGTGKVQIMDGSSNEQADIVFTEEQWIAFKERVDFDDPDETFTLRLVSVAASDAIDWQRVWFVRNGEYRFNLPTWIADRFVIKALFRRSYMTRSADSDEVWLADSAIDDLLYEGEHYYINKSPADVNARTLMLTTTGRRFMDDPLILVVACPWSAPYGVSTLFTSYTSTSLVPLDLIVAKTWELLGRNQGWEEMEARGSEILQDIYHEDELEQFELPKPAPWLGPSGGLVI